MKDKLLAFWESHSETIITLGYKVILALVILVASALIARSVKKAIKNSKSPLKRVDSTLLPLLSSIAGYLVFNIATPYFAVRRCYIKTVGGFKNSGK